MSSYGIEDARKALGDLITTAAQGSTVTITRNGRPVADLIRHQEPAEITLAELTAQLGFSDRSLADQERVARFAGAFRVVSDYTKIGRIPPRWAGQGTNATFTQDEAEELVAAWTRTAIAVGPDGAGAVSPVLDDPNYDPQEVADRYWP